VAILCYVAMAIKVFQYNWNTLQWIVHPAGLSFLDKYPSTLLQILSLAKFTRKNNWPCTSLKHRYLIPLLGVETSLETGRLRQRISELIVVRRK